MSSTNSLARRWPIAPNEFKSGRKEIFELSEFWTRNAFVPFRKGGSKQKTIQTNLPLQMNLAKFNSILPQRREDEWQWRIRSGTHHAPFSGTMCLDRQHKPTLGQARIYPNQFRSNLAVSFRGEDIWPNDKIQTRTRLTCCWRADPHEEQL